MDGNSENNPAVHSGSIEELRSILQGEVIAPGDAGYEQARKAWNLTVDQYPALIVFPADSLDVPMTVRYASQNGLGIAVQATGHGVVRPADGCLLLVTDRMRDVRIDPLARTAWVGAGVKWGQVLEQAQGHGLAPLLGSSPGVGAVGYTLGGGMGWLVRKYGLSADSVRYFELVTADGQMRRASGSENRDLFWALRGGGGGFGVVTGMEIELYPLTNVYGGNLLYPADMAKEVMRRYREWIADAPDELSSSVVLMNYPPLPAVPEFLRGKSFVMVRGCYCGPVERGRELVDSWRSWKAPMHDFFLEMPFTQVATVSNDPVDPVPGTASGAWLNQLSDEVIDTLIDYGVPHNGPSPYVFVEVRHAGGAVSRVDASASAYSHRDASLILNMIGMTPTPEVKQHLKSITEQMKKELEPYLTGGVYMNFLDGEESRQRVQQGYSPEAFQRLAAVKVRHDPDNIFRFGFSIPLKTDA